MPDTKMPDTKPSGPLRVAFMATAIGGGGGMERYAREMLRALGRRADVELVAVVPEAARDEPGELIESNLVEVIALSGRGPLRRGLRERYGLDRELERCGVDVVHGAKHFLPRTTRPTVLTAQDIMLLTRPESFTWSKRLLVARQYRASLVQADVVIAVSHATQARIDALLPDVGRKTVMIPNGVTPILLTVAPEPIPALGDRAFALAVGDPSPRKNLEMLLDLWERVWLETGLVLLAVGPPGWKSSRARRRLASLEQRGLVVWAQHVSDAQLRWAYEHTRVVLIPSKEEGYGLPVAEALALGAEVIASTDPALMEIGQGRSRHVPADDPAAWHALIAMIAAASPRPATEGFVLPTWEVCAASTVDAYRRAVAGNRGRR